jgi:hypothetical protein
LIYPLISDLVPNVIMGNFTKKRLKITPVPNPKKNKNKKKPKSPAIRVSRNTPHGILKTGESARALRGL